MVLVGGFLPPCESGEVAPGSRPPSGLQGLGQKFLMETHLLLYKMELVNCGGEVKELGRNSGVCGHMAQARE